MKKITVSLLLLVCLFMLVAGVSAYSEIGVNNGAIPPGTTDKVSVYVSGLNEAEGLNFNLTFDKALFRVDNVSANSAIPGSAVYANINNESGYVDVAVTNGAGITVQDYYNTPVVDVYFTALGIKGESSEVKFDNSSFYSKGFEPVKFDSVNNGQVGIRNKRTLIAPDGNLIYGQGTYLPVQVANITGAKYISIYMSYDGEYVSIENIVSAEGMIIDKSTSATNGKLPQEHYESAAEIPDEIKNLIESEQVHGSNWAYINLMIPDGFSATDAETVAQVYFTPTEKAGTSNITISGSYRDTLGYQPYAQENFDFDSFVSGQVVTSGGGNAPCADMKMTSGKVVIGKSGTFPVQMKCPGIFNSSFFRAEWDYLDLTFVSAALNASAADSGATIDQLYNGSYIGEPAFCTVTIGNLSGFSCTDWTSIVDFTFSANRTTEGSTWLNLSDYYWDYPMTYAYPGENVTIYNPAKSIENGVIAISEGDPLPDFVPDVSAPHIVKVNHNDTVIVDGLWLFVTNLGKADYIAKENVLVVASVGDMSQNTSFKKDIKIGAREQVLGVNLIMNASDYNIDPEKTEFPQDKLIEMTVNPEPHVVEEMNYANNSLNHSLRVTVPDLAAEIIAPSKTTQFVSKNVIGVNVTNKGEVASEKSTMLYQFGADEVKVISVPSLAPNASVIFWENKTALIPGEYPIKAHVNPEHKTDYETTYTNNEVNKTLTSYAEPVTKVEMPKDVVYIPNSSVELPVVVKNVDDLAGFKMRFTYNSEVINVTDVKSGEIGGFNKNSQEGYVVFNGFQNTGVSGDVTVATLVIDVIGVSGDETALDISVEELFDENYFDIQVSVTDGDALLMLYGDANNDKKVNLKDALKVLRWVVGIDTIDKPSSGTTLFIKTDVTKNDHVDVGDAMFIGQKDAELRDDYFNIK